ncbi:TonB-linked SusC/RagA family outer membrane protein [Lutibacter sp. Hel_I_33_5]|uniref:SusC/RagA family TonB-linked outer membrane protein n=1 Tax=Lutibacter sp. Hel_I_33_5 TaxID=1566289 RepID=UPI0011A09E95|nr:TonB-dependent receptor [Lutibacter sp. Hel_I_33_5]TVZ57218.1 TonB-linked SusC/RagA family outer membrane protein [Lutibacter sp. Hel_I_33_5]
MRKLLIVIVSLFFTFFSYSQDMNVSGVVTDTTYGDPLPGVSIIIKGTTKGTQTDFDGNYTIQASKGAILVFNYLGFKVKEVTVSSSTHNVKMEESSEQLDEVVVVGYGSQRKELVSGSFSSLNADKIAETNPTRIEEALTGNAAGVQVTANSGSPGSSLNIRIRGITTNGNNAPLVIVDGVNIGEDLSVIDPNDIEKMDIIKDASSAIYGVQAANGVILITTKAGKKNRPTKFAYNSYYTIQEASNQLDLMNATEYAVYVNETEIADGNSIPYPNIGSYGLGTDWQKELFTQAQILNHSISASGGSETITHSTSASIFQQDGIINPEKSNFNRLTIKNNLGIDLTDKLKLNTLILYTNINRKTIPENGRGSALYHALNASPLTSIFDGTDGTGTSRGFSYIGSEQGIEIINPFALINNTYNETKVNRFTGKLELSYNVIDDLKVTSRYNFNYADVVNRNYYPLAYYGPNKVNNNVNIDANNQFVVDTNGNNITDLYSTVAEDNQNYFDYTWESFLEYKKTIGNHNFNFLLGTAFQSVQFYGAYGSGSLVGLDNWENAYLFNSQNVYDEHILTTLDGSGNIVVDNKTVQRNQSSSTGINETRQFSVFGRMQYDYEGKYLLSAMVRRDASTYFGPNNRVGYFPSVSLGWIASKEDFFKSETINNFKVRGSWGITGSDKIKDPDTGNTYRWIGNLQGANAEATYPFGNVIVNGNAQGQLANPDLQWETNTQINVGFDLSFLDNMFDITFDYYTKTTENLLLVPEVSGLLGATAGGSSPPVVNAGTIENKGIDLSLNFNKQVSDNFKIGAGLNITTVKNKTIEVNNAAGFISSGTFGLSQNTSRFQTGLPIGTFYGLKTDGVFQNQAEISAHATQAGAKPGDLRFVDVDGDGVVEFGSEDDLTVLGNPIPEMTLGFNLNMDYKGFDFSSSLYASLGNDVVRSYERFLTYSNKPRLYLDRWTGEGTSNTTPRASTNASNNYLFSDFFVEDASFLRIQNVQVGYSIPSYALNKLKMDKVRIYLSANNLYTFTKYSGYNPDVSNSNPSAAGVDLGQYPQTRTYTLGVNVSF